MTRTLLPLLAAALAAAPALAQTTQKRPLAPADYDQWRSIRGESVSDDGRWVVFSLVPQVGDGEVVVRSADGTKEYRHTRGYIGRPQTRAGARGMDTGGYNAPRAEITDDARFVVFTIDPPRAEVERTRRERRRGGSSAGKTTLGVMALDDGCVMTVAGVKSFKIPEENGRWLAWLLEPDSTASNPRPSTPDSAAAAAQAHQAPAAAATPGGTPRPVSPDSTRERNNRRKETGSTLVLRDLNSGNETRIEDVVAYVFDREGKWLGYTVSTKDGARDGAYVRSLSDGSTHALLTGRGGYRQLAFDRAGTQAAFLSDRDEQAKGDDARYALYHAALRGPRIAARKVVDAGSVGRGLVLAERGRIEFARDGQAFTFGVAAPALDSIPADSLADKAVFDLWHWQDPLLQSQQRVNAPEDRERAVTAVYHVAQGRHAVLASDTLRRFEISRDMRTALAEDPSPYSISAMWGEGGSDVYVIDGRTGERRLVERRVPFDPDLSPEGRFVAWYGRDRAWHAYETATGRRVNLTGALPVPFDRETWDTPGPAPAWGIAGWTAGDRTLLVYDRYDVWEVDPTGRRAPRMVTDSAGRRAQTVLRVVDLDRDEEAIDPSKPLLLRAFDDENKGSGYWRDRLGAAAQPERLVMEDRQYGTPVKADEAEVYVFTRETGVEFPDLWASGPDFRNPTRLSNANPQQASYRWAQAELVRWRSDDGVELKGILYKPEDFDPTKKYPMVVYFYEQMSNGLHDYNMPGGRNVINSTVYASNGYLVFEPDIHYTEGYPGESAMRSIVPGVRSLIARGFVDDKAVALQGQSWGGYQAAYMVTRTNMFRAAMVGAPVANMTSAYGGIRWQSGQARPFQYERGQSRIGASLWEQPARYIENSPLFAADRISTPLFIMHNDGDGAVPFGQGIELFVALRRLGKEVYLINYNGDEHNPTKRANQIDVSIRMMQFFDHHLRGAPAPEWMRRGVPFLQKGRDQVLPPPFPEPVSTEETAPAAAAPSTTSSPS